MLGVIATFDRDADSWSFSADFDICNVPVYMAVVGQSDRLLGCRVGFTAVQDGNVIADYVFPPEGQKLISSDQSYIGYFSVEIPSDSNVSFTFFFEDKNGRHEQDYVLRPATTEMPEDGRTYKWSYDHWVEVP